VSAAPTRRAELEQIFRRALVAVDAETCVLRAVEGDGRELALAGLRVATEARVWLLAAGKAAAPRPHLPMHRPPTRSDPR
jgi:glycerate-2-kinase